MKLHKEELLDTIALLEKEAKALHQTNTDLIKITEAPNIYIKKQILPGTN